MKLKGLVAIIVAVGMLALVSPVRSQDAPPPAAPPAGEMKPDSKGTTEKHASKKSGKKHKKGGKDKDKAKAPEGETKHEGGEAPTGEGAK